MVWNIFAVIGMAVTILLLGAGALVWAVVIRNAYTAFLSARASATPVPQGTNATLPGIELAVVDGNLIARNQVN